MSNTDYIEIILRAIIINDGKILLCQSLDESYYYLPGGHLEKGETLENALKRELMEEAGVELKTMEFLDFKEHFFNDNKGNHHEINIIYKVKLDSEDYKSIKCLENHFLFIWVEITKLAEINLLPSNVKEFLLTKI